MLDNFGFGEFFFLALLALLFFGPERLPQIGAKLGQWVSTLTQYSKAFMTEWNEEALAIHDAVQEVKGIRDEIAAARAEIAGTLNTARTDVNSALSGARADVQQQIAGVSRAAAPPAVETAESTSPPSAAASGDGESAAIAKTQQMLDDLREKLAARQAQAAAPDATDTTAAETSAPPTADTAAAETAVPGDKDTALAETRQMLGDLREKLAAHQERVATRPSPTAPPGDSPAERGQKDVERLRARIDGLETGIHALREELAALRDLVRQRSRDPALPGEPTVPVGDPA